jgi:hypothetical protein
MWISLAVVEKADKMGVRFVARCFTREVLESGVGSGRDEGAKMWRQFGARMASMAGPSRDDKLDRKDAARTCKESWVGDMIET